MSTTGQMIKMPSTTSNQSHFSTVPKAEIPRSQFDRSYAYKTTFNSGYLIPFFCTDILPGDTVNLRTNAFARLATPLTPFMDNLWVDTHYFFVPWRLLWVNFQKMMGEQINPGDSTSYITPVQTVPAGGYVNGTLADYFGLPTQRAGIQNPAAFRFRAYNKIYNDWFRDENLQNSLLVDTGDGPDLDTNYVLKRRGKRFDYFTGCLPFPQKGPSVNLPLGSSAPVRGLYVQNTPSGSLPTLVEAGSGIVGGTTFGSASASGSLTFGSKSPVSTAATTAFNNANANVYADLTSATAATINQLRQAFQIQRVYERDARGGTRYTEILKAHFGVTSDDARLQRAEYLGGGTSPININPLAQTSSLASQPTPLATLAAVGTAAFQGHGFTKSFVEHGTVIGLLSVRADLNYQQGMERHWSKSTRFDYYLPALSHIGEQAVLNQEIYAQGTSGGTADASVFGYQERWAEERYSPSIITGQFRSNFATPLDMWHLAENFTSLPTLSGTFIESNPPIARVIAVPSYPQFLLDAFHSFKHARAMPTYSVPGLIDHF